MLNTNIINTFVDSANPEIADKLSEVLKKHLTKINDLTTEAMRASLDEPDPEKSLKILQLKKKYANKEIINLYNLLITLYKSDKFIASAGADKCKERIEYFEESIRRMNEEIEGTH